MITTDATPHHRHGYNRLNVEAQLKFLNLLSQMATIRNIEAWAHITGPIYQKVGFKADNNLPVCEDQIVTSGRVHVSQALMRFLNHPHHSIREVAAVEVRNIFLWLPIGKEEGMESKRDDCRRLSTFITYLTNVERAQNETLMDKDNYWNICATGS